MEQDKISKLFNAFQTLIQMLEDRGFYISKDARELEKENFKQKYELEHIFILIASTPDNKKTIGAFMINPKKSNNINNKTIEEVSVRMKDNDIPEGIIISDVPLSNTAQKLLVDLDAESELHLEFFHTKELIINITKHELVPKHEVVEKSEINKILERYKVKLSQLPKILLKDPVAKYYGLRRGEVVKIIRKSETAGLYVTYRLVI